MATITQNGITFNYDNTKSVSSALSGIYTHMNNKEGGKYYYDEDTPKVLMGLDIDWNSAVLPNANPNNGGSLTVQTTAELLNLINEMQKEIYALTAAVIALSNK